MKLISTNPSTGEEIGSVESTTPAEIDKIVAKAKQAQNNWAKMPLQKRITAVESFVKVSEGRRDEIAELIARETGRTIESSYGNVDGGFRYFRAYCSQAEKYLAPTIFNKTTEMRHEPHGVVAAICPWNYPFMNVAWQCGQALIAGNAIVYKNSELNPMFAKLLAELVAQSDLPDGIFSVIFGDGKIGEYLARSDVDMISFTGSSATGRKLAAIAGEKLIPIAAELGGSAPLIIFEDFEIDDEFFEYIWQRRFKVTGQACDAVKRLIVHKSKFNEVVTRLAKLIAKKKVGDAMDETVDMGPLISLKQLEKLEAQVFDAVKKGAKVICGGARPASLANGGGQFYEPTLLANISRDMKVWREETFGPVLPVVSFDTEDEAIDLANDTEYGLNAHVFTNDAAKFARAADQIKVGMIGQNYASIWDPELPFGGAKSSGLGRTHGATGWAEVTEIKVVARS